MICVNIGTSGLLLSSSSGDAAIVCEGDQLTLTCSTTENSLIWQVLLIDGQGRVTMPEWFFSSTDYTDQRQQLVINHTNFTSTRTSAQKISPLVSDLVITNVSNALNMTEVSCAEIVGDTRTPGSLVSIYVIPSTSK